MTTNPNVCGLAALACVLQAGLAQAEPTQNVVFDNSVPRQVLSINSTGVVDMLQGASAFAFFDDGSSARSGFTLSGDNLNRIAVAQTAQFALVSVSDVTRDLGRPVEWSITNTDAARTLVGFAIDGRGDGAGHAAFDINFGPSLVEVGTPGSERGATLLLNFSGRTFVNGSVTTTYSQPLGVLGAAPVGDLFARVDVALAFTNAGLNGGLPPARGLLSLQAFGSDLDRVDYATSPVPEPGAAWLALLGLVAVAVRRGMQARSTGQASGLAGSPAVGRAVSSAAGS